MAETLIRIETLSHFVDDGVERKVIDIAMTSEDRQRVRRRIVAEDGVEFGLELPTGTTLTVNSALHITNSKLYRIIAASEDVLTVKPRSISEAAFIGHLIGNLHRDIDIVNNEVIALWNAPLEKRLQKAELDYVREQRAFNGKPAGEHSH